MKIQGFIIFSLLLGVAMITGCSKGDRFTVEGTVTAADGDTLYLEHRALGGVVLLDSVVLSRKGTFRFRQPAAANPEFYQLRLGDRSAAFAVDSSETLRVTAEGPDLYRSFRVSESPSNDLLRQVDQLVGKTTATISQLEEEHKTGAIDDLTYINRLDTALLDYKGMISKVILGNPAGAAAYYALFQKINSFLIFDPYTRQDYPMFGAVATSWNRYYPDTERTRHLYEFTMNALKVRRQQEQQAELLENAIPETGTGLPDILLPSVNGEKVTLSSLKGKVVLLDFTVYGADFSPKHNMDLNRIYERYRESGFEIYQVSFDSDEHFWKTAASNLPWITLRDPQSVNSRLLPMYNVRELPTAFIVNREGDVVVRVEAFEQLESELKKLL
ncbi:MAG: redoxin domain-containing protein [Proteiniphilum sp.]|jgi:peroxiredoxin|nr:redoxin domain-containing protein [Proteiniphilum sp.]HHT34839.1 AhpC/TSA family protein [Bacteroidales bacterium]MDD3333425.1 redoxin domain-containing protein [Proteiniphilum sp.]MDD3980312.1 redoxin domain-containing protein [Proteiniphilum sp.]MDD4486717.1 redoxin domain-containing protein [Proteiniphilum sp.]